MWHDKFDSLVLGLGFLRSKSNHCVCYKHDKCHFLVITLYVDDKFFFCNNKVVICDLNYNVLSQIDIKDLGAKKYILRMEVKRDKENRKLWLSHNQYVKSMLQCFHMIDCKLLSVPISMETKHLVE